MAFYLKYRPRKISELDLVDIREKLKSFLMADDLPHAFLFTGTRGIGKTSSARIWAQAINCEKKEKKDSFEPCGECRACLSISKGSSLDIIEMDAASNRSIDDVRLLREKIKLSPTELKYKVYIIDEVHMLTKEAFNALLKTLEEPPKHAMFVLCTTDPEKLPETILSRCIQLNFRRANDKEIMNALGRVIKGESLKVDEKVLEKIASLANGSFRDATKFLEEAASGGKEITLDGFEKKFGMGGGVWSAFGILVETKDSIGLVNWIEDQVANGADIKSLAGQMISNLHERWMKSSGEQKKSIYKLLGLIDEYWWRLNTSLLPQLPLELAVCEWVNSDGSAAIKSEKSEEVTMKKVNHAKPEEEKVVASKEAFIETEPKVAPQVVVNIDSGSDLVMFVSDVQMKWDRLLGWVKERNISVEALLRAAKPVRMENNCLVMEVAYPFHKEKLLADVNRRIVETGLAEVLGTKIQVNFELKAGREKKGEPVYSVPAPIVVPVLPQNNIVVDSQPQPAERKKVSTEMPATADDDELMKFAEELFMK